MELRIACRIKVKRSKYNTRNLLIVVHDNKDCCNCFQKVQTHKSLSCRFLLTRA